MVVMTTHDDDLLTQFVDGDPRRQSTLQEIMRSTPRQTLRREGSYINMANQQVRRAHRRLCVPGFPPPRPSFIHGSPGQPLLSLLGVLRRPAGPADRAGKQEFITAPYIYAGSIRRAFAAAGVSYYIAAGRSDPAAYQPSPRCFALEVAALHADLSRVPRRCGRPRCDCSRRSSRSTAS